MVDNSFFNNDLKEIDKREYFEYIIEHDPYGEIDELCDKLNKIKNSLLEKASLASMGSVVESSEDKPIIGTQALDTCYGILFYDRLNKKGLVGHGAPSTKVATLSKMIRMLDDGSNRVIEYMIIPGFRNVDRHDTSGIEELLIALKKYCPSNIKFVPFKVRIDTGIRFHKGTLTYEFAFDTRNGKFVSEDLFFDEKEVNPRYINKNWSGFGK